MTEAKKRKRERALPSPQAYAFTIQDGQAMGLPGKSKIYEMIADGTLKTVKVGGRTLLKGDSVRAVLGASEAAVA
jgi:excisionase family DNA binding protein